MKSRADRAVMDQQNRYKAKLNLLQIPAWYALHVRSRHEKKVAAELEPKGLTMLGIMPNMMGTASRKLASAANNPSKGGTGFKRRLITYEDPKSPISESYRSLRTNVSYSSADKKIRSLLISSSQPGEGKSTTTANLAIALIVKAGQTERAAVSRALDVLSNVRAPLIGAILNGASQESLGGNMYIITPIIIIITTRRLMVNS